MRTVVIFAAFLLATVPVYAQQSSAPADSDSVDLVETVERFHTALGNRDRSTVDTLLLPDALILEGGGLETKEEYFGHHFGADAGFLSEMRREVEERQVRREGETAWISTKSHLHGTYKENSLDLSSAETMVLRKTTEGWRIAAIHWSSRSRE